MHQLKRIKNLSVNLLYCVYFFLWSFDSAAVNLLFTNRDASDSSFVFKKKNRASYAQINSNNTPLCCGINGLIISDYDDHVQNNIIAAQKFSKITGLVPASLVRANTAILGVESQHFIVEAEKKLTNLQSIQKGCTLKSGNLLHLSTLLSISGNLNIDSRSPVFELKDYLAIACGNGVQSENFSIMLTSGASCEISRGCVDYQNID